MIRRRDEEEAGEAFAPFNGQANPLNPATARTGPRLHAAYLLNWSSSDSVLSVAVTSAVSVRSGVSSLPRVCVAEFTQLTPHGRFRPSLVRAAESFPI